MPRAVGHPQIVEVTGCSARSGEALHTPRTGTTTLPRVVSIHPRGPDPDRCARSASPRTTVVRAPLVPSLREVAMVIAEFGTGQVFWSMLWFFLFFIWIWLLIVVISDIFRSDDLSGWGKALWTIFIIVLPYLAVFVYLIARGGKMQDRSMREAVQQEARFRQYVQDVATGSGGASAAEEIARLADLRDRGVIDESEFQQAKARALG